LLRWQALPSGAALACAVDALVSVGAGWQAAALAPISAYRGHISGAVWLRAAIALVRQCVHSTGLAGCAVGALHLVHAGKPVMLGVACPPACLASDVIRVGGCITLSAPARVTRANRRALPGVVRDPIAVVVHIVADLDRGG